VNQLLADMPAVRPTPAARSGQPSFALVAADVAAADRIFDATLAGYRSPFGGLVEHLNHYRGKRLRPALLLFTAHACGRVTESHLVLAAAVEMIHTATLVHDDVLDEADTRRHVRTVNAEWGNKISILFGDMLFTHAFHLTSRVDRRACELIGEATNRVCAGELRQVSERGNLHLTEADYYDIVDGKTAALTEVCGRLGAEYAGVDPDVADRLAEYGRCLGVAFQIADDVLDLTGNEATAGKTLGTDIEQQKLTLPMIHALGKLPSAAAAEVRTALQTGGEPARRAMLAAVERCGSISFARKRADELARQARQQLDCLPMSEARTQLELLTEWAVRRDK
jgi:octaprenyl-diphosphate synthase